jgi:hypothetical protein
VRTARKSPAIYKQAGGRLFICIGEARPTSFSGDYPSLLVTLRPAPPKP